MRPLTRLVLGLVVLVGLLAAVALGLPPHVTVSRSQSISAPESVVFPYLNNLRQFAEWSPWKQRDPELKLSYSGPEQGKGAQVQWTSEKPSIGTGRIEILESEPNRKIELAVNFNGLEGTGAYNIVPDGSGSKVTWVFGYDSGSSPLKRWKALMLDGFVGAEYSAGLERLKKKIEEERRPMAPAVGLTEPQPGQPGQTGQPAAAAIPLPPGAVAPPAGTAPQGAAVPPGQAVPGAQAPTGGQAPAPGQAPAAGQPAPNTGTAQSGTTAAPAPQEATPAPVQQQPRKKRRRRQ